MLAVLLSALLLVSVGASSGGGQSSQFDSCVVTACTKRLLHVVALNIFCTRLCLSLVTGCFFQMTCPVPLDAADRGQQCPTCCVRFTC